MKIAEGQKIKIYRIKENEHKKNCITALGSSYAGKNKNGENVYSYWQVDFVGEAFLKLGKLMKEEENKTIILMNANIEHIYNKEKEKNYLNLTCFEFKDEQDFEAEKIAEKVPKEEVEDKKDKTEKESEENTLDEKDIPNVKDF